MVFIRRLYTLGLTTLGLGAIAGVGYYVASHKFVTDNNVPVSPIGSSASTLTASIVDSILKDPMVVDKAVDLVAKAFLHPTATQALKDHFVTEFTENEETMRALKRFIVDDVIQDQWVSEELISLSKQLGKRLIAEPTIWPGLTLELLKEGALEGLAEERFKESALSVAKSIIV